MSDPAASPAQLPICPKKGSLAGRAAGSLITYNYTCTLSLSVDQCGCVKMKSSVSLLCGRLCVTERSTSMVFDASPLFYKAFNTTAGCRGWRWVSRWQQIHDDSFIDDGLYLNAISFEFHHTLLEMCQTPLRYVDQLRHRTEVGVSWWLWQLC